MAYAVLQDLVDRAGSAEILQIADRDGDDVADPEVVDAALEAARVQIDAYLAIRYGLPLDPVPDIVRAWAVSIARYVLHRDGPPDYVVRDQRDALAALKDAAAGRLALPGVVAGEVVPAPTVSAAGIGVSGDPPAFGPDRLQGWL